MSFSVKVPIRVSRKKTDEQDGRKAQDFLHGIGNASLSNSNLRCQPSGQVMEAALIHCAGGPRPPG